jgi:hypothetical protein
LLSYGGRSNLAVDKTKVTAKRTIGTQNTQPSQSPDRYGQCLSKMKIPLIIFTLIILTLSCKESQVKQDTFLFNYPAFSIEVPKNWKKVEIHSIDSNVGGIAIDSTDTLEFEIGPYAWNMIEYDSVRWKDNKIKYISNFDTSHTPILYDSTDLGKVKRSNAYSDIVNGYKSKILVPIHSGRGFTGIYIDSLWVEEVFKDGAWKTEKGFDGKNKMTKFSLYGNNLKADNEKDVLQAIKTIKFHKVK